MPFSVPFGVPSATVKTRMPGVVGARRTLQRRQHAARLRSVREQDDRCRQLAVLALRHAGERGLVTCTASPEPVADRRPRLRDEQVDAFVEHRPIGGRDHEQVG